MSIYKELSCIIGKTLWVPIIIILFSVNLSLAEVSISDPLWDWKYDAIERLALAFGERTVSNTRPVSRLEMAGMVLRISVRAGDSRTDDDYLKILLKRLEDDLKEEIKGINDGTTGALEIKPFRWARVKAVHTDTPLRLENDYGFNGGKLSLRGEVSTSGKWDVVAYDIRPEYNLYRDDTNEDKVDLHSGYVVAWLKNFEIEMGKDALWWGPGRHGNWVLTNNAPAFELIKLSNAVTTVPPWPLSSMGDTKLTAFLGRLSEQRISYLDGGMMVEEYKRPMFAGVRLDFSPSRYFEIGAAQTIQFIDRGGRGYSFGYLRDTFLPTYNENETEDKTGPVANRVQAFDVTLNLDGRHDFMKALSLRGMKFYWTWGGETMVKETNGLPATCFTGNLFGLYLDTGRTEIRSEYAANFDAGASWYDHYQFTEGYRNEGFVLGHPQEAGNAKDIFISISHAVTDTVVATVHFDGKEWRTGGAISRENDYGVSVDVFGKKGQRFGVSYEYRGGEASGNGNNLLAVEAVQRF